MDYEFLLRKIRTLQEGAKTEGERRAADKAAKRIMEKYGISDIDQYRIEEHTFKYSTLRERRLLVQIITSTLGESALIYRLNGKKTILCEMTEMQAAEIEYSFDYFRHLYKEEEELLYIAFINKHDLFPKDGTPCDEGEYTFEYLMRLHHLMEGLSDSSIHKALPEQGGI